MKSIKYIFRKDKHDKSGAGLAILVSDKFNCNQNEIKTLLNLEAMAVTIKLVNGKQLNITEAYAAPSKKLYSQDLKNMLNNFNSRHTSWGDSHINTKGRTLLKWYLDQALEINLKTIRSVSYTYANKSIIDLFFATVTQDMTIEQKF